ncbi:uncharacterized protein BDZ83DRAFT_640993 [Colletotrichum acutatum]|uniref:Secreted protein n=1 Tax=Glomerella acutata TaxID=27357 RepID=A0AAD8UDC1_GLOAC|nr:uncharacterized protein BDZ83DRAFT_640993 [Colletotrichum acutatum]KAK1709974.1 hypothetical protein BDZ83DRAFT_640993 [Colletotrichum acutatum]
MLILPWYLFSVNLLWSYLPCIPCPRPQMPLICKTPSLSPPNHFPFPLPRSGAPIQSTNKQTTPIYLSVTVRRSLLRRS